MPKKSDSKSLVPAHDPLDSTVSIKAGLTEAGITVAAQSRTLAALDSLCGSFIDASAGAWLDGIRRRRRAKDAVEERLIYEEGESKIETLRAERARSRFLVELSQKQETRENIASITLEELKILPSPEKGQGEADDSFDLDQDWMNAFSSFAENATQEGLKRLWARVLAGELKSPGAFSRSTLRVISELNAGAARAFGQIMPLRFSDGYFFSSESRRQGVNIGALIDNGLVQAQEMGTLAGEHEGANYWISKNFALRINYTGTVEKSKFSPLIEIPLMRLSRPGREISSIFPLTDEKDLLIKVGKDLDSYSKIVELLHIDNRSETGIIFDETDILTIRQPPESEA